MLFIDLYVTDHRRGRITLKASLIWSGVWIATALLFNLFLYFYLENGHQKALMIFSVMDIKPENQPHILKWGILSAIVFRIVFIFAGVANKSFPSNHLCFCYNTSFSSL